MDRPTYNPSEQISLNNSGILIRFFWLAAIAISVLNAVIVWVRIQREIRKDPALAPGYLKLVSGYALWTSGRS